MLDSFLRHVTKDSYGPISFKEKTAFPAVVHKFNDAFSVLNWGKMPEPLQDRGRISAFVFSNFNQKIQSRELWKSFLKSPEALSFRKAGTSIAQSGSVSSMLNELAETFPMKTNFLGVIDEVCFKALDTKAPLHPEQLLSPSLFESLTDKIPMLYPVCEYFPEEKVPSATVMGRSIWDYSIWKKQATPKMLPFEFLCHFTLSESSLKSLKVDSISLPKTASLHTLQPGVTWDFPVIELFLPQDPFQKRISLSEAIWMTEWSPEKLQKTILTAAWVATFARKMTESFQLQSVQLRFAINAEGELILCDVFSLDDLVLVKENILYHAESAIEFYQKTAWYENVIHAKKHAEVFGLPDWKRQCVEPAPWMDPKFKQQLESHYQLMAKTLLGK